MLPGSDEVIRLARERLPQPEQMCGPFWIDVALTAVTGRSAGLTSAALAAGTRIYPHDVDDWRPARQNPRTAEWAGLPVTDDPLESGTDASGVYRALTEHVHVAAVSGPFTAGRVLDILESVCAAETPVVVIANIYTGLLTDPMDASIPWSMTAGHFCALTGMDRAESVVRVADSYPVGDPPGQHTQPAEAMAAALERRGHGAGGLLLVSASPLGVDHTPWWFR